jgi:hypothetical protein
LLTTYRPDSTAGRGSYGTGAGTGDGSSLVWPVVVTDTKKGARSNNQPFQRVFAKSGDGKSFTTQVLTGSACTTALSNAGMPTGPNNACGKNWDPDATVASNLPPRKSELTTSGGKADIDPWYPTFRRCKDISQGVTTDISQANTNPNYFNNPNYSAHWIGVRIDYTYKWFTATGILPLPGAGLQLSDRAVKIMEPNPANC